jgi:uncharacterized membrane protein
VACTGSFFCEKQFWCAWFLFLARFFVNKCLQEKQKTRTTMQRTNTNSEDTAVLPSEISPEFAEWLMNEKADALRHQRRIFKATMMLALAIVLFLLKQESEWVAGLLDLDAYAAG